MESNHHRLVKSQLLALRATIPNWCSVIESNDPLRVTRAALRLQSLQSKLEPHRGIKPRVFRLQGGCIVSNACRANWCRSRESNPASRPYQGLAPSSGPERRIGFAEWS